MSSEAQAVQPGSLREAAPRPPTFLASLDLVLRDRAAAIERIRSERELSSFVRDLLVIVLAGAAIFGGSLGGYRGGLQVLYAGIKLPLVLLLTMAASAPALSAVGAALGREVNLRRDLALVLAALARASLTLAALTPVVLLSIQREADYHWLILITAAVCGLAGVVGLVYLLRGLLELNRQSALATAGALCAVFTLVGTQMSWTLRPYLVRPRDAEPSFVRSIEGNFFESVRTSLRSSAGIYSRSHAPLPGELESSDDREGGDAAR